MRDTKKSYEVLKNPNFRWLWAANGLFFAAQQIELLALQWIVLDLTESKTLLGLVATIQGLTILTMSPFGGVIGERMPRRNLLVFARGGLVIKTLVLGTLIFTGNIQVWHIIASVMAAGVLLALAQPATQSFLYDVVGGKQLPSAIALNASAMSVSNLTGPALGGIFIAVVGVGGAYFLGGSGYLIGIMLMLLIPIAGKTGGLKAPNIIRDFGDGLRYVRSSPLTMWVLFLICLNFFGSAVILMRPVYARDVLQVGAAGLGMMGLFAGMGSLVSSLLVPVLFTRIKRLGVLMCIAIFQYDLGTILFAISREFPLTLAAMFIVGAVGPYHQAAAQTMLQVSSPDNMRSRVLSFFFMVGQFLFFGQLFVGAVADATTPMFALLLSAGIRIPVLLIAFILARPIRNFGREESPQQVG